MAGLFAMRGRMTKGLQVRWDSILADLEDLFVHPTFPRAHKQAMCGVFLATPLRQHHQGCV